MASGKACSFFSFLFFTRSVWIRLEVEGPGRGTGAGGGGGAGGRYDSLGGEGVMMKQTEEVCI